MMRRDRKKWSQESNDWVVYKDRGIHFGPFEVFFFFHSRVLQGLDRGDAFQTHFQGIGRE